jgi:hypothetical protein
MVWVVCLVAKMSGRLGWAMVIKVVAFGGIRKHACKNTWEAGGGVNLLAATQIAVAT